MTAGPRGERRLEHEAKVAQVRVWASARSASGVLFATPSGFSWISAGGESHVSLAADQGVGAILVTSTDVVLLTNVIEHARLLGEELEPLELRTATWPWDAPNGLGDALAVLGAANTHADMPGLGRTQFDASLTSIRFTLTNSEVDRYRGVASEAATALEAAARSVTPGVTEHEVAGAIARECHRSGLQPLVVLVAFDGRIERYRHPLPTANVLRNTAMLVLTARKHGLQASLTRMVTVAGISDELRRRHDAVAGIDAAMLDASRPGRNLGEVIAAGVQAYSRFGFPEEWKLHHQGGLTGYAGREIFGTAESSHVLQVNQVVAWNPSITGTKSEDTALVAPRGVEVLTQTGNWPMFRPGGEPGTVERPDILALGP